MYGLIGSFKANDGKRDELVKLMVASSKSMPGCLSYIVAIDPNDENLIWVTEVWEDRERHKASLNIPEVRATIEKAMPLIASFGMHQETKPVSGYGLK